MPGLGGPVGYPNNPYNKKSSYSSSMANYGQPLNQNVTNPVNQNIYQTGTPTSSAGGGTPPGTPNSNIYGGADANYIRNLATAYTPEQILMMRNNIRQQNTGANTGGDTRLREYMAQQGLGGSGAEASALGNLYSKNAMTAGNQLAGLDISNAQTDLANRYAKAGLLNNLMGTGLDENKLAEMARQFDVGQYNDMYKFGQESDYQRYLDRISKNQYNTQLQQMLQMLGLG